MALRSPRPKKLGVMYTYIPVLSFYSSTVDATPVDTFSGSSLDVIPSLDGLEIARRILLMNTLCHTGGAVPVLWAIARSTPRRVFSPTPSCWRCGRGAPALKLALPSLQHLSMRRGGRSGARTVGGTSRCN